MKKFLLLTIVILSSLMTYAQENPNRMLVHKKTGTFSGYLVERVDSVTFAKIEGVVKAEVSVSDVTLEDVTLSVTRTADCPSFKLDCLPTLIVNRLENDAQIAEYVDGSNDTFYSEDFPQGKMTGIEFAPNTEYTIVTVGYDRYGIPCGVSKAAFTTPKKPLVGNPNVTMEATAKTARSFTCSFTPNSDVNGYAVVAGEKGTMQAQYEQWGPMMGFKNFGDLVKAWGVKYVAKDSFTWSGMEPNTEYEVFIQAWDENETYADCQTELVKTDVLGGPGAAAVDIKLGDYKLTDWDGQMLPSQFITFTPNDQSSCMRLNVALASEYDKDVAGYHNDLKQDPPMPMSNWFFYEPLTTDFQINPNVEAVAIGAAKNSEGNWGEVTVLRFTTPAAAASGVVAKSAGAKISKRAIKTPIKSEAGVIPSYLNSAKKELKLIK